MTCRNFNEIIQSLVVELKLVKDIEKATDYQDKVEWMPREDIRLCDLMNVVILTKIE